jgi:hypothetical protein
MSWTSVAAPTTEWLSGVWGSGSSDAWFVGTGGAMLHWDGRSLTPVDSGTANGLNRIWGDAVGHVWTVGDWGTILGRSR